MPDITQIPTEQLQAMLNQAKVPTQSQNTLKSGTPDISTVPTEQLQAMLAQAKGAQQSTGQNLVDKATAASSAYLNTVADLGKGISNIVGNVASLGARGVGALTGHPVDPAIADKIKSTVTNVGNYLPNKLSEFAAPHDQQEAQAISNNPRLYGAVGAAGTLLNNVAAGNAMGKVLSPLSTPISKVMPLAAARPAFQQAADMGIQNATVGALSDPNHPIQGALIGGVTGTVLGGITGHLGEQTQITAKAVDETIQDLVDSGRDPLSYDSLQSIQDAAKTQGLDIRKYDAKQLAQAKIEDIMNPIRPEGFVPGRDTPLEYIGTKLVQNFPKAQAQNDLNYRPIDINTTPYTPKNFLDTLDRVKDNLPVGLPNVNTVKQIKLDDGTIKNVTVKTPSLTDNPTISNLLDYRRQLDQSISTAKKLEAHGKADYSQMLNMYSLRESLNNDIHQATAEIPFTNPQAPQVKTLEDQLNLAEKYNIQNIQPFKVVKGFGNQINENLVWNKISRQLNSTRPNFDMIRKNISMLGDDGKSLAGWGVVEHAISKATANSSEFKPEELQSRLTALKSSGVLNEVADQRLHDVVKGISDTITAGTKAGVKAPTVGKIGSIIQNATHSPLGIDILRRIGSQSTPAQNARTLVQQLFTGFVTQEFTQPAPDDELPKI